MTGAREFFTPAGFWHVARTETAFLRPISQNLPGNVSSTGLPVATGSSRPFAGLLRVSNCVPNCVPVAIARIPVELSNYNV